MFITFGRVVFLLSVLLDLGFCHYDNSYGSYYGKTGYYHPKVFRAFANIIKASDSSLIGKLTFTQNYGDSVTVKGSVTGLAAGTYKIDIHEYGDVSGGCANVGNEFDPTYEDSTGVLGTFTVTDPAVETNFVLDVKDLKIDSYKCYNSIIGRSIVIHGPDPATAIVACGTIGISPSYYKDYYY